jgi:catechol 2,3-dioxygenase-like lactoylglutathione lyase family enzyme
MASLLQITPFLRVPDIAQAIALFCDTLGFELEFSNGPYAFVRRDRVAFRMIEDEPLAPRGHGRYTSYMASKVSFIARLLCVACRYYSTCIQWMFDRYEGAAPPRWLSARPSERNQGLCLTARIPRKVPCVSTYTAGPTSARGSNVCGRR